MAFQLDTSGVVPFEGGTLGLISWEGVGQRGGLFTQGYVEALLDAAADQFGLVVINAHHKETNPAFSDLARETLARIIEDCARAQAQGHGDGAWFWEYRQEANEAPKAGFPPLTLYLGDDGLVRFDQDRTYPNGARMFAPDGTMLDDQGNRSIFDDVDQ